MKQANININFTAIACIIIAAIAVGGLLIINQEIPVFNSNAIVSPRDYPFWALIALILLVSLKLIKTMLNPIMEKLPVLVLVRLVGLVMTMVLGLFLLSTVGFLISASIISVISAFLFGERKFITGFLPLIIIVLAVDYLTVYWLNIPLPSL